MRLPISMCMSWAPGRSSRFTPSTASPLTLLPSASHLLLPLEQIPHRTLGHRRPAPRHIPLAGELSGNGPHAHADSLQPPGPGHQLLIRPARLQPLAGRRHLKAIGHVAVQAFAPLTLALQRCFRALGDVLA